MTTTTTIAPKQTAASPAPPSPPCSFQEESTTGDPEEPAVEKDTSVLDALGKEFELASDEPVVVHDDSDPDPGSQADWTASAAQRRLELAEKNGMDAFDAWLGLDTPVVTEKQEKEAKEPRTSKAENKKIKPLSNTSTALLDQNKYLLEGLSWYNQELLRQNQYLIEQLAKQNKFTIDRLVPPPLPPVTLCVGCGTAGDQKSGGGEKKKSKSSVGGVDTVIRRILRIFSLIMLVVIAVQLGFVRGEGFEGRNGRRTGFFGR